MIRATGGTRTIAVIGAGLAGAVCANELAEAGHKVTVFEKSGGTGGRLSTRRSAHGAFDHGAQYLTAKGPHMTSLIAAMTTAGAAGVWAPDGKDRPYPWHVGLPGMSGFVKPLLAGIEVRLRQRVTAIEPADAGDVILTCEDGQQARADMVIVTAPAPQALALTRALDPVFAALADIRYAPCWAAMLAFDGAGPGWPDMARGDDDAPMAWLARGGSRPARAGGARYVVHAGGAWSARHLEHSHDVVLPLIMGGLVSMYGAAPAPLHAVAHRWRHARVDRPLGTPFLAGCEDRVAVCGDGLLGGRAEAAVDSAMALVAQLSDAAR